MLFEEWEEGTDLHVYDEYKLAESLYNVMPNNFDKKKLYKLRLAMTKDHFSFLCSLANFNATKEKLVLDRNEELSEKCRFTDRMIHVLKSECDTDVLNLYINHEMAKASFDKAKELNEKWKVLNGNKHNNDQED